MLVRTKDLGSTKTHVKFSKRRERLGPLNIMPRVIETWFHFEEPISITLRVNQRTKPSIYSSKSSTADTFPFTILSECAH